MNAPFDPTDFEGLDPSEQAPEPENILDRLAVKKPGRPKKQKTERPFVTDPPGAELYFRPLGYDRDKYFFFTSRGKQIRELSASKMGKKPELLTLAPLDWWEREFQSDAGFTGKAVDMACNYLMQACYARGVFSPDQRRGRGVWRDLDNIVIHAGDRLYVDGVEVSLVAAQTEAVYECQERIVIDMGNPLTAGEAGAILEWAKSLNWECPTHALLVVGWMAVAIASGALEWRPHIFPTGPKGSGKSSILNVLQCLMHGFVLSTTGSTSAAGLRQALQSDALAVMFDEAEGDSQKASANIDDVLALMRHASSSFDAKVIKGGADGRATATLIRSCFCLSAIRDPLHQAADQSRVTMLSLKSPSDASRIHHENVTKPLADRICAPEYASRFRARILTSLPTLLESIQVFKAAAGELFTDSRMADQIGALMGGAWVALRDGVPTLDQARQRMQAQIWTEQRELVAESSDEEACLRAILEAHVKVDGEQWHGDASVGELVNLVRTGIGGPIGVRTADAVRALSMYGIKVDDDDKTRLLISNNNGMLGRKIMAHTTWPKGWGKLLARLPGALKPPKPLYVGGVTRVVSVVIPQVPTP